MINLILFGTFFIFLLLNTPIAVSLGMSSILAMMYAGDKMSVIPTNLFSERFPVQALLLSQHLE